MDDDRKRQAVHPGWARAILFPSLASGTTGGGLLGSCCGWLLAPPHHFFETILGSTLAGTLLGFVIAWLGAAVIGLVRLVISR
jgi:hypothetical protein